MSPLQQPITSDAEAGSATLAPWRLQRAAIIGSGAMGTLLAAVLGSVVPVILVCRDPARAAALFEHGAAITGLLSRTARPIIVRSIADIPDAGGADAVFVATKTTAISTVALELAEHLNAIAAHRRELFIISFQNGIDSGRELMQRLGHPLVLRMVLTLGGTLGPDGRVNVTIDNPPHGIGSVNPAHAHACAVIAHTLSTAGLETTVVHDIESLVWRKAIINAAVNPVAALANCSVGEILDSPSRLIFERLLEEAMDVAAAAGIELPDDYAQHALDVSVSARRHIPSMVEDIRQGRESEVGQLNRQIIDRAHHLGVHVPTHEVIDALIETFDWKVYRRNHADVHA